MDFSVVETQKGKSCIVYKEYKFRQSKTLANGEVSWCCLGRTCRASIKTNARMTELQVCNEKHTGHHPVTLRSLSRTQSPASSPALDFTNIPSSPLISQLVSRTMMYEAETQTDDDCLKSTDELLGRIEELTSRQSGFIDYIQDQQVQLAAAKETIVSLRSQQKETETDIIKTNKDLKLLRCKNIELMEELASVTTKHIECEKKVIEENSNKSCPQCNSLLEEAGNMIETIRTLETELNSRGKCSVEDRAFPTMTVNLPHQEFPITTSNRYSVLNENPEETDNPDGLIQFTKTIHRRKIRQRQNRPKQSREVKNGRKLQTKYLSKLYIFGDSHARNLNHELKCTMPSSVDTYATVNPGAPIEHIVHSVAGTVDSLESDDYCVLVGGTNNFNVKEENQDNNLNRVINSVSKAIDIRRNTNLLVCPILHRHDLHIESNINEAIVQANGEIQRLVESAPNCTLVDTSSLDRRNFTRHGLHLNGSGKRKLCAVVKATFFRMQSRVNHPASPVIAVGSPDTAPIGTDELPQPQVPTTDSPCTQPLSLPADRPPSPRQLSTANAPSSASTSAVTCENLNFLDLSSWPSLTK